jgi:hypothetical protein
VSLSKREMSSSPSDSVAGIGEVLIEPAASPARVEVCFSPQHGVELAFWQWLLATHLDTNSSGFGVFGPCGCLREVPAPTGAFLRLSFGLTNIRSPAKRAPAFSALQQAPIR